MRAKQDNNNPETEPIPRPEGEGWEPRGAHWERFVRVEHPCCYCGSKEIIESTHSWPYCADCKAV